MQNKGIVIVTAVLLTLASIFYLSFSAATSYYDKQAAKLSDPIAAQNYKDSVKYLGVYSYQQCLETQIGLGLDLKGGMNVILEISVPDVVDVLADHKTDAAYQKSMAEAKKEEESSQKDFITLFINAYKKNAPGHRLAEIFATQQLKGKVSTQSSDAEENEKKIDSAEDELAALEKKQAERMLAFCSNAGPSFIFGILSSCFQRKALLFLIWGIQILSAWTAARFFSFDNGTIGDETKLAADSFEIETAIWAMLKICGWVILFRILIFFLERWFLWIVPLNARILLIGLMELSNGCCMLDLIEDASVRFVIANVLLAFGGICVVLQTSSVCGTR